MKKYVLSIFLLLAHSISFGKEDNSATIKNSSYVIFEGASEIMGHVPASSKYATFYTFDGEEIKKEEYSVGYFSAVYKKLDPSAPKPQPRYYKIQYWPAFSNGYITKGQPGDFVVFYDKNGNRIQSCRYNRSTDEVSIFSRAKDGIDTYYLEALKESKNPNFPFDLSKVKEEK